MKALSIAIALLLSVRAVAAAELNEPMLMKDPLPPGLSGPRPKMASLPDISSPTGDDLVACLRYDIGPDGTTSNIKIFHSTGMAEIDDRIVKWYSTRKFEPAALNDAHVSVRLIGTFYARAKPAPDLQPLKRYECSWAEAEANLP